MGIPRFFKVTTPKRFQYNPLYWDPEQEEREERVKRIKQEMGIDVPRNANRTTITRGSFRQNNQKVKSKASRDSNRRLLIIVVVLLFLAYLIFYR